MVRKPITLGNGICGVYVITCVPTGEVYIGSSKDVKGRWRAHRSSLDNHQHENRHLQRAWDEYGSKAFTFSLIEECSLEDQVSKDDYDKLSK